MGSDRRRRPHHAAFALAITLAGYAFGAPLHAQTSLAATVGDRVDRTTRADDTAPARHAPDVTFEVGYGWHEERARVFYGLDTGTFSTTGDWFYQAHTAGATARVGPAANAPALFVGGSATWHGNGDAWPDARYAAVSGFATVQAPRGSTIARAGYRIDHRWFPELNGLDQLEHGAFGGVQTAVQKTRTTIIGELHGGLKRYGEVIAATEGAAGDAVVIPTWSGRGRGRGMGPQLRLPAVSAPQATDDRATAGRVLAYGRVAQSVAARTALSLEGWGRWLFGDVPPALVATPELLIEDGVYDDPFASEAMSWRAGAKHVTTRRWQFEAGVGRWHKDFTGTLALDAEGLPTTGDPLRADRIWRGDGALTVPLWPARTRAWELDLVLSYLYTRHTSNDAFYNYRSHRVGAALSVGY
jgi:hypothetical protein